MIELFFVSCLTAEPAACQNRSLVFTDMTVMACMVHGQQEMARWMESHPGENVREWKCRGINRREARI